jgi:hypothetical protein
MDLAHAVVDAKYESEEPSGFRTPTPISCSHSCAALELELETAH